MTVDIALAASARDWPDRIHRHVLDHGGARVSGRLMGATQCVDSKFDVIFIDDVCSFLSPRLVTLIREKGSVVVGVFDPADGSDAKRRLLECGISDVIESNATPEEFLVRAVSASDDVIEPAVREATHTMRARSIGVVGVTDGVGATELAVTVAVQTSRRARATLVDLDPSWPSVAQRLNLPPHPNLRTLIDVVLHGGQVDLVVQYVGGLNIAVGSSWLRSNSPIAHHEMTMVLGALADQCDVLVADLGAEERVPGVILNGFDNVILVTSGDPVGVARLLQMKTRLADLAERCEVLVAVNMASRRPFYKAELRTELTSALDGIPFVILPFDEGVRLAAWEGDVLARGAFSKETGRIADLVAGSVVR